MNSQTNAGEKWLPELIEYRDSITGARGRQLTCYMGHSRFSKNPRREEMYFFALARTGGKSFTRRTRKGTGK